MSAVRAASRGLGELLITAGVVLLLFCGYQLVWTNVEAGRAQHTVAEDIERSWNDPRPVGAEEVVAVAPDQGDGIGFLHVPRLGESWRRPIVEGVAMADLARGVGRYPDSGLPGEVGNLAIAGHRATNGEPFRDIDRLDPGDSVVVETRERWLSYEVESSEIVSPSAGEVILPVPKRPDVAPTERRLTLTTCHPRWSSEQRLIVYAVLSEDRPKADGAPAALLAAGG